MPDLSFDTSILLNGGDLVPASLPLPGMPAGTVARPLRYLDDGSLRSTLVDLPKGWASGRVAGAAAQQGYVTHGTLRDGDATLEVGTFFFHPAGHPFSWHAEQDVGLILILNAPQAYAPAAMSGAQSGAIIGLRPADVPVTPSLIDGKASGVIRRVLWQDPVSGADTRHLTIPQGVSGLGAEWHPCNEEIFCLTRDTVAGDAHPFRAGSFLFNPAFAVHGGNRTVNAAQTTMLEWHDGLWAINRYTE
ncbi:MAG: hypothetical protein HQ495_07655 [Alphaproteobacteria bacterium]|nr:hypothetical protein [Alphaproteobacteria bacterium]